MGAGAMSTHRGLEGYAGFFLVMSLAVIVAIIYLSPNTMTALVVVGLVTNFLIIASQTTLMGDRAARSPGPAAAPGVAVSPPLAVATSLSEGFTSTTTAPPGGAPPAIVNMPAASGASVDVAAPGDAAVPGGAAAEIDSLGAQGYGEVYPGAIDFGGESPLSGPADEAPAMGHADLTVAGGPGGPAAYPAWGPPGEPLSRDGTPRGNPFDTDRIASAPAAGPCVDDDALAIHDGDELNTYQARSRNDMTRVWAGIYRRKSLMDRYVREELDEEEDTRWWGRAEK